MLKTIEYAKWTYWHSKRNATLLLYSVLYTLSARMILEHASTKDNFLMLISGIFIAVIFFVMGIVNLYYLFQKNNLLMFRKRGQFVNLEHFYRGIKIQSFQYLLRMERCKSQKKLKKIIKSFKSFELQDVEKFLNTDKDGDNASTAYGIFNKKDTFSPIITEKILDMHMIINDANEILENYSDSSTDEVERILQDITILSMYIARIFNYLRKKEKALNKTKRKASKKLEKVIEHTRFEWAKDLLSINDCSLFSDTTKNKVNNFKLYNFGWVSYKSKGMGRMFSYYLLPLDYVDYYIKSVNTPTNNINNKQILLDLVKKLSTGGVSTLLASLDTSDSQVGTGKGSENHAFLLKLKELGMAEEKSLELSSQPDMTQNVTAFLIREKEKPFIKDILATY